MATVRATVKLPDKPAVDKLEADDQVVIITGGNVRLISASKLGRGGAYGFAINADGDLVLTYEGDTPPNYAINDDGCLILTVGEGQTINLGRVQGTDGAPGKDNLPNVETLAGAEQSLELAHNVEYRCAGALTSLTVTGFGAPPAGKAALYSIQFTAAADGITVTLPETVVWAAAEPVWTAGSTYWITWTELGDKYLAVWVEVPNG